MTATFSPIPAGDTAQVLIDGFMDGCMDSSIDQLCAAVSEDIGMPVGRVRRVALALERQRLRMLAAAAASPTSAPAADPRPQTQPPEDPLRWYPLGANGRLRPPAAGQP